MMRSFQLWIRLDLSSLSGTWIQIRGNHWRNSYLFNGTMVTDSGTHCPWTFGHCTLSSSERHNLARYNPHSETNVADCRNLRSIHFNQEALQTGFEGCRKSWWWSLHQYLTSHVPFWEVMLNTGRGKCSINLIWVGKRYSAKFYTPGVILSGKDHCPDFPCFHWLGEVFLSNIQVILSNYMLVLFR